MQLAFAIGLPARAPRMRDYSSLPVPLLPLGMAIVALRNGYRVVLKSLKQPNAEIDFYEPVVSAAAQFKQALEDIEREFLPRTEHSPHTIASSRVRDALESLWGVLDRYARETGKPRGSVNILRLRSHIEEIDEWVRELERQLSLL